MAQKHNSKENATIKLVQKEHSSIPGCKSHAEHQTDGSTTPFPNNGKSNLGILIGKEHRVQPIRDQTSNHRIPAALHYSPLGQHLPLDTCQKS